VVTLPTDKNIRKKLADKAHSPRARATAVLRLCGIHSHPTTLLKPRSKEFNKAKKEGIIKTTQGASYPPMWDKE